MKWKNPSVRYLICFSLAYVSTLKSYLVLFFAIRLRSFNGDPAEENKIWDKQNGTFAETEELTKSI